MKSLIKFIDQESQRKGKPVTTTDLRGIITQKRKVLELLIVELNDLEYKTYQYELMEHTLEGIQNSMLFETLE